MSSFGISVKPAELVELGPRFDMGEGSIFNDGPEEGDPVASLYSGYAEGGIVQDYDVEQLIKYLKGSGN